MAFTRVLGPGIHTASNINSHNINSTGIITAVSFVGDGSGLTGVASTDNIITGTAATFNTYPVDINAGMDVVGVSSFQDIDVDGHTNLDNVSIAGVTTVANDTRLIIGSNADNRIPFKIKQNTSASNHNQIDSRFTHFYSHDISFHDQDNTSQLVAYFWNNQIGLYTYGSEKLRVTGSAVEILNGNLSVSRDLDVDGHTNLDNVNIAGVSTFAGAIDLNADLDVDGHTNLDNVSIAGVTTTTEHIRIDADNKKLQIGDGQDLQLWHNGTDSFIKHIPTSGGLYMGGKIVSLNNQAASRFGVAYFENSGDARLYWTGTDYGIRLKTTQVGIDIPLDLDVDGHTNLDNVSIAGVTTFSGGISGSTANLTGALTGTTANFSGNVTVGGVLTYEDVKNVDSIGIATARAGLKVLAGGANIVGVVTATSFVGDGSNLTGITQTTINSNVNNYLITGTGTANTLQGESGLTFDGSTLAIAAGSDDNKIQIDGSAPYIQFREGTTNKAYIQWSPSGYLQLANEEDGEKLRLDDGESGLIWRVGSNDRTVWTSGNDGSGSGLDADVLDGIQASSFVRSDATDTLTGEITLYNNLIKFSGTSNDRTVMHFIKSGEIKWRLLQNSFNAGGGDNLNFDRVNGTGVFMVDGYRVLTTSDINAQASGAVHSGISTFQDIDVDGHTNLDNVSIAGVTTITQDLDVDGHTNLDNVSIAGVTTFASPVNLGDNDRLNFYDTNTAIYGNSIGLNIVSAGNRDVIIKSNDSGGTSGDVILKTGSIETLKVNGDGGINVVGHSELDNVNISGVVTATAFKLADGSAIGAGAGGTWSTYTAGIATSKSVGVNTSNLDDNDLVGVGNSFQGLYISNGMIIHDNTLSGNHYIGTAFNGLMAGPVNIEGTLSIDGSYVVV